MNRFRQVIPRIGTGTGSRLLTVFCLAVFCIGGHPAGAAEGTATPPVGKAMDSRPVETVSGGPVIRFDTETVNFGRAAEGDSLERLFTVYNDGDAPLIIHEVKPT